MYVQVFAHNYPKTYFIYDIIKEVRSAFPQYKT